jgi:hypothetical protein
MKIYEVVHFQSGILVAAEKTGWKHTPINDRCIGDLLSMTFEKILNGTTPAILDIIIDTELDCIASAYRNGAARMKAADGTREAKIERTMFDILKDNKDLFDPEYYIKYGKWVNI